MKLVAILAVSVFVLCFCGDAALLQVGGSEGWKVPSDPDMYIRWASDTHFQLGDTIEFSYTNDSVLIVSQKDYETCNTSNPIQTYLNDDTYYRFDQLGSFYFISGEFGHCELGQKMVVQVSNSTATFPPPTPTPVSTSDMPIVGRPSTQVTSSPSIAHHRKIIVVVFVCIILFIVVFIAVVCRVVWARHYSRGFSNLQKIEMGAVV